jgi:ATP-dependent Clp protease ATP-binding subunit ClpB
MDMQNFTHKSLEALEEAQSIALENNCMQIEQEHLAKALLEQENGLIPQLLQKMGIDPKSVLDTVEQAVKKLPSVTGPGREPGKIYFG